MPGPPAPFYPAHMKVLFVEACNYQDFPVGGQLTWARQILSAFGDNLWLVGIATDETPLGTWGKLRIGDKSFPFFAIQRVTRRVKKPLIPRRWSTLRSLKRYKKAILQFPFDYSLCCAPEVLLALKDWDLPNLTYNFSGTENPLRFSRRWYGRLLSGLYDRFFYSSLKRARYLLAAADQASIRQLVSSHPTALGDRQIVSFPTRIDTSVFRATSDFSARNELQLPPDSCIVTTSGRLHWAKGWPLLVEAFREFLSQYPDSYLYFLGDGDCRPDIERFIRSENLADRVKLPGFQSQANLAKYLQSSDLFVMGSLQEGWSTALLEAKGCHVPICTTNFSSAKDIVRQGVDGFVVDSRDARVFSQQMARAIGLRPHGGKAEDDMEKYAVSRMKPDLLRIWGISQ
jgi:glycosyltransferase involved in cell wall biosynthesis